MGLFTNIFGKKITEEDKKINLFNQMYEKKDFKSAIEVGKDIEIGSSAVLCQRLAFSYYSLEEWETSMKYYKKLHFLVPETDFIWKDNINSALIAISFRLNDYQDCIKRIQSIEPDSLKDKNKYEGYQYAFMLGFSFQELRLYKQAIEAYKSGRLSEQYPSDNQIQMIKHTAECYEAIGNKKQAINFYEKFISKKFDPDILKKIESLND